MELGLGRLMVDGCGLCDYDLWECETRTLMALDGCLYFVNSVTCGLDGYGLENKNRPINHK